MEEELLAQPQVMKLLDSLREQYTRYQELCRQRNKRTQLDEIHAKVMQVKHTHTYNVLLVFYLHVLNESCKCTGSTMRWFIQVFILFPFWMLG